MKKHLVPFLVSLAVALVMMLVLDQGIGLFIAPGQDLVFTRYSTVHYSTPEMNFTVRVNNLGFRGRNLDQKQGKRPRILLLGDSFTYGWGVNVEDSWASILESNLQKNNIDAEIANLGQGGISLLGYADIGERAIPLLQPDLVIVSVLQGDDLAQTMTRLASRPADDQQESESKRNRTGVKHFVAAVFPNLIEMRHRLLPPPEVTATDAWKLQVEKLISRLSATERAKLDRLDGEIAGLFLGGGLNPGLLSIGLQHPDHMQMTLELDNPDVQSGIEEVAKQLLRIRNSTLESGGKVIVVAMPSGYFVSPRIATNLGRMGLTVTPDSLETTAMDEAIRRAAVKANIGFFDVTAVFRAEASNRELFYAFDNHPNAAGNRLFADGITPIVIGQL